MVWFATLYVFNMLVQLAVSFKINYQKFCDFVKQACCYHKICFTKLFGTDHTVFTRAANRYTFIFVISSNAGSIPNLFTIFQSLILICFKDSTTYSVQSTSYMSVSIYLTKQIKLNYRNTAALQSLFIQIPKLQWIII